MSVAFYVVRIATIYGAGELFHRLGVDWTLFYAQAMVVRSGNAANMYDALAVDAQIKSLTSYYHGGGLLGSGLPVPYPPWFSVLMQPFTWPPAPVAFAVWLA